MMLRLMVMRGSVASALIGVLLALAACGESQETASTGIERPRPGDSAAVEGPPENWLAGPPYAAGALVGEDYEDYWLHTHCGVNGARIDGSYWDATNGSARRDGWADPYQQGTMRMTSQDRAVFTSGQQTVEFARTLAEDYPPCA